MPLDINSFMAHYDSYGGVAKADKFDVMLHPPLALQNDFGAYELALQCEAAEFPSIDITVAEYRHYGFIQRIPLHLTYAPVTLTFFCNAQFTEKKLFDSWINLCIPNDTGLINYRDDDSGGRLYESDIGISQYDLSGREIYNVKLLDAFPIAVSQLVTNWSDDSIHRLTVTFVFTKWQTLDDPSSQSDLSNDLNIDNFKAYIPATPIIPGIPFVPGLPLTNAK